MLETVLDDISDSTIALDQDGRLLWFNAAAAGFFLLEKSTHLGLRIDQIPSLESLGPLLSAPHDIHFLILPSGTTVQARILTTPEFPQLILLKRTAEAGQSRLAQWMRQIVHDLKTPVGSIKGFLDLLKNSGPLNERQAEQLRRAGVSMDGMVVMIDQLLDVAWVDGTGDLERSETDLNELAQHAVNQLENYARKLGVELSLETLAGGCVLLGNERGLESAISNLISNAIKYSPDGGRVCISIQTENGTARVTVEDSGIGIDPKHLPRIFEPFYRVKETKTRRIEGSGLGLALVKDIVERHGGQVFVFSTPGKGSQFGFTLPKEH